MDYIYFFLILKLKCTCFDSDCSDSSEECDNSLWNYNKWYNNADRTISSQDLSIQMYSKPARISRTQSIPQNMHFYIKEKTSCIVQKLNQPLSFKELIKKDLENKIHLSDMYLKDKKPDISVRRAKSDVSARPIREKPKKVDYNTFIQRNKAFLASFNTSSHEHTFPLEKINSTIQSHNNMMNERRVKRQVNTRSFNLESIQENEDEDKFFTETSNGTNDKFAQNVFLENNSQINNLEIKSTVHSQPLPQMNARHSVSDYSEIIKSIKNCHIKDITPFTSDNLHTIENISYSSNEEEQIINVDTLKRINYDEFQKKMKKLEKDKEKVLKKQKKPRIPSILRKKNEHKQFDNIKVKSSCQEGYSESEHNISKSNNNLHFGNILRSALSLKSLVSDAAKKRKIGRFSSIRSPKKSKNFCDSASTVHVEANTSSKILQNNSPDTVIRITYSSSDERFFEKNPFYNCKDSSSESDLEETKRNLAEGITKPINYKKEKKCFDYLNLDDLYFRLCEQRTLIPPPKPRRTFEYDKYIKSVKKNEDPE